MSSYTIMHGPTQHDEPLTGSYRGDHVEAEPSVEATVLHCYCHHQARHEHHIGALSMVFAINLSRTINDIHLEIVPGHLICAGHARQGEEHQGQEGGDGQR